MATRTIPHTLIGYTSKGRPVHLVRGGSDDAPQDDNTDQPTDEAPSETDAPKADDNGKGGKDALLADLAKERRERQKAQRELEALRQQSMSDAEKAVEVARKEGEKAAAQRYVSRLVDEVFRAATVGRTLSPDALLTFDRSAFLTEDGDVDREGLTKWVEANAAPVDSSPKPPPSFGGGARKTEPPRAKSLGEALATRLAPPR